MCVCFLSARSLVPFTVHPHGLFQHLWFFLYWSCEVPKSLKHKGPSGPHLNNKRLLCQGPLDLLPLHKYMRIKGRKIHLPWPEREGERASESTPANWSQIDVKHDCLLCLLHKSQSFFLFFSPLFCYPGCPWLSKFKNLFSFYPNAISPSIASRCPCRIVSPRLVRTPSPSSPPPPSPLLSLSFFPSTPLSTFLQMDVMTTKTTLS